MEIPVNYEVEMLYNSAQSPNNVHCRNTALVQYYTKYLFQKVLSVFKFSGIPDYWSMNYFLYVLFGWGYVAVINTDKYGVIPQLCGLAGYNVFYQPTTAVIGNPLLNIDRELRIGTDTEIIKVQPDYSSVMDIVTTYGDIMRLCLETAGINLINSKLSYVFFASHKNARESMKKRYDKYASGELITVVDKTLKDENGEPAWQLFTQNVGQNYISDRILNDMKTIEDRFNTDIGIPNANTQKRERMIVDEVNVNNVDTQSKVLLWLETMQDGINRVNKMFGTNIAVEYRYKTSEVIDYEE